MEKNTGTYSDLAAQMAQFIDWFQGLEAAIATSSNLASWHDLTAFKKCVGSEY